MIDEKKLQQLMGKMIGDLGAAISVPLVRIGVRLGLYKAMDGVGPMTSAEFATKATSLRLSDLRPGQPTIRVAAGTSDGIRERRKSILHRWWI